jgi:hypothetical protein
MDLTQITIDICKELSKNEKVIEPTSSTIKSLFSNKSNTEYYGFIPKKKFELFHKPPIFKLKESNGRITLISLSREYDDKIEKIAKRDEFAYTFEEPDRLTFYP